MCVIFGFPFPWHDPVAQELHRLLYLLFPTAQQATLLAVKAGIDMGLIWQQQAAVFLWKDILDAAATGALTRQLVVIANKHITEQHPNKRFFIDLLDDRNITFTSDMSPTDTNTFLGASDADEFFREFRVRVGDQEPAELEIAQATTIRVVSNLESVELQRLTKSDWAVEFGRDVYGVYGDFELESAKDHSMVQQRLSWIPPGRFQMGSPPEEPGRYPDENLQDVTISEGFWMFDAPCSQRLGTAIMDDNPSHFLDTERPVESVDWAQAKEFAARLNQALGAHAFQLPTEAQWEYACRAGTSTAIYTDALEIIGDANAPALDPIAWYGGNSGHKYDLEQSEDITKYGWSSNKQFPFTHAGTRKIKQRAPNPWGLYDMLGNVWEWCEDWYAEKRESASVDPRGPESGSDRVIRGGGWIDDARNVRSACRDRYDPGFRNFSLGVRLLSSASSAKSRAVAERVVGSRRIPRDEAGENQRTK